MDIFAGQPVPADTAYFGGIRSSLRSADALLESTFFSACNDRRILASSFRDLTEYRLLPVLDEPLTWCPHSSWLKTRSWFLTACLAGVACRVAEFVHQLAMCLAELGLNLV